MCKPVFSTNLTFPFSYLNHKNIMSSQLSAIYICFQIASYCAILYFQLASQLVPLQSSTHLAIHIHCYMCPHFEFVFLLLHLQLLFNLTKTSQWQIQKGFCDFYRNPLLKPEETFQDKFALKLYKPTNLDTAIKVNSYPETLEICMYILKLIIALAQLNSYLHGIAML